MRALYRCPDCGIHHSGGRYCLVCRRSPRKEVIDKIKEKIKESFSGRMVPHPTEPRYWIANGELYMPTEEERVVISEWEKEGKPLILEEVKAEARRRIEKREREEQRQKELYRERAMREAREKSKGKVVMIGDVIWVNGEPKFPPAHRYRYIAYGLYADGAYNDNPSAFLEEYYRRVKEEQDEWAREHPTRDRWE